MEGFEKARRCYAFGRWTERYKLGSQAVRKMLFV